MAQPSQYNAFQINRSPSGGLSYSGLGGMSGAQPKAGNIAVALRFVLRSMQRLHTFVTAAWINEVIEDIDELVKE
jgi:urocanate hydratase